MNDNLIPEDVAWDIWAPLIYLYDTAFGDPRSPSFMASAAAAANDMTDQLIISISSNTGRVADAATAARMLARTNAVIASVLEAPEIISALARGEDITQELAGAIGSVLGGYLGSAGGAPLALAIATGLGTVALPAAAAVGAATAGAVIGGFILASVGEDLMERLFGQPTGSVDWIATERTMRQIYGDDPETLQGILSELSTAKSVGGEWATDFVEKYGALVSVERVLCFLSGTMIDMWPLDGNLSPGADGHFDEATVHAKSWRKPIEEISIDDIVVSFDGNGKLRPGKVTRLLRSQSKIILDFFGTFVTPGHVYRRADRLAAFAFEPLIDILRDDGAVQTADGLHVRATTGVPIDDPRDCFVWAIAGEMSPDGKGVRVCEKGRLRLGTRFITPDGKDLCIADLIEAAGGIVTDEGLIRIGEDEMPFHWSLSDQLPKPEDYILQRSGTTLIDIYRAAEWGGQPPSMPVPIILGEGSVHPLSRFEMANMPRNTPLALMGGAYAAANRPILASRSTWGTGTAPHKPTEEDRGKLH